MTAKIFTAFGLGLLSRGSRLKNLYFSLSFCCAVAAPASTINFAFHDGLGNAITNTKCVWTPYAAQPGRSNGVTTAANGSFVTDATGAASLVMQPGLYTLELQTVPVTHLRMQVPNDDATYDLTNVLTATTQLPVGQIVTAATVPTNAAALLVSTNGQYVTLTLLVDTNATGGTNATTVRAANVTGPVPGLSSSTNAGVITVTSTNLSGIVTNGAHAITLTGIFGGDGTGLILADQVLTNSRAATTAIGNETTITAPAGLSDNLLYTLTLGQTNADAGANQYTGLRVYGDYYGDDLLELFPNSTSSTNRFRVDYNGDLLSDGDLTAATLHAATAVTAQNFVGGANGLTNGNAATFFATGTVPLARLDPSVVTNGTGILTNSISGNAATATSATKLIGSIAGSQITNQIAASNLPNGVLTNTSTGVTLSGTFSGNGTGLTNMPNGDNTSFWVSTNGSDSNIGTNSSFPFLSLTNALAKANATGTPCLIYLGKGTNIIPDLTTISNHMVIGTGSATCYLLSPQVGAYSVSLTGSNTSLAGVTILTTNVGFSICIHPQNITNGLLLDVADTTNAGYGLFCHTTPFITLPSSLTCRNCTFYGTNAGVVTDAHAAGTNSVFRFYNCLYSSTAPAGALSVPNQGFLNYSILDVEHYGCVFSATNLAGGPAYDYQTGANTVVVNTSNYFGAGCTFLPPYSSAGTGTNAACVYISTQSASVPQVQFYGPAPTNIVNVNGSVYYDTVAVNPVGNGTGLTNQVISKNGSYTLAASDDTVIETATTNTTITLPAASSYAGRTFSIKNGGTGTPTISAGQNIDGASTKAMPTQYDCLRITSDGTQWWIVSEYTSGVSL